MLGRQHRRGEFDRLGNSLVHTCRARHGRQRRRRNFSRRPADNRAEQRISIAQAPLGFRDECRSLSGSRLRFAFIRRGTAPPGHSSGHSGQQGTMRTQIAARRRQHRIRPRQLQIGLDGTQSDRVRRVHHPPTRALYAVLLTGNLVPRFKTIEHALRCDDAIFTTPMALAACRDASRRPIVVLHTPCIRPNIDGRKLQPTSCGQFVIDGATVEAYRAQLGVSSQSLLNHILKRFSRRRRGKGTNTCENCSRQRTEARCSRPGI